MIKKSKPSMRILMATLASFLFTTSIVMIIGKQLMAENLYLPGNRYPRVHPDINPGDKVPLARSDRQVVTKNQKTPFAKSDLTVGNSLYHKTITGNQTQGIQHQESLITSNRRPVGNFAVDKGLRNADIDIKNAELMVEQAAQHSELIVSGAAINRPVSGNQVKALNPTVFDLVNQMNGDLETISGSLTRISEALLNTSNDSAELASEDSHAELD